MDNADLGFYAKLVTPKLCKNQKNPLGQGSALLFCEAFDWHFLFLLHNGFQLHAQGAGDLTGGRDGTAASSEDGGNALTRYSRFFCKYGVIPPRLRHDFFNLHDFDFQVTTSDIAPYGAF